MIKPLGRYLLNRYPSITTARLHLQMLKPSMMGQNKCAQTVWSEGGEDQYLVEQLGDKIRSGFYVDVGANHPARISMTYRLYCMGMRGICVEPNEVLSAMHARYRPGDQIINTAIGPVDGFAKYYVLSHHAFSTFSEEDQKHRVAAGMKLKRVEYKPTFRLSTVLEHVRVAERTSFELLNVDVEGWDLQVLKSNDWDRFRPRLLIIESNTPELETINRGYLSEVGYQLEKTFSHNGVYRDTRPRSA